MSSFQNRGRAATNTRTSASHQRRQRCTAARRARSGQQLGYTPMGRDGGHCVASGRGRGLLPSDFEGVAPLNGDLHIPLRNTVPTGQQSG